MKKNTDEGKKEKLTRKKKKALTTSYYLKNPKPRKYEVSEKDTQVSHRRKSKKYNKKLRKFNLTTRVFPKAESIFNRWLEKNIDRFNTKLIKKSSWEFYFEGVVENVMLFVNGMPEAGVAFEYHFDFDIQYIEYIGDEAYNPQKGYYDADRVDNIYTYFSTREELYINGVFEKIITYCNKKIVPQNSLYLFDYCGGSSGHIDATQEDDPNNIRTTRSLCEMTTIEMTEKEAEIALKDGRIYRMIKIDLFDTSKKPIIRYYPTKKSNDRKI